MFVVAHFLVNRSSHRSTMPPMARPQPTNPMMMMFAHLYLLDRVPTVLFQADVRINDDHSPLLAWALALPAAKRDRGHRFVDCRWSETHPHVQARLASHTA